MKKKYQTRFPLARIKKIMQTDEDVGKIAIVTPILISKCLELFMQSFLEKASTVTLAKNSHTLSAAHIRQCVQDEPLLDFLSETVENYVKAQPQSAAGDVDDAPKRRGRPKKEASESLPTPSPLDKAEDEIARKGSTEAAPKKRGRPKKQTADAAGPIEGEGGSTAKKRERKTAGGDAALLSDFDLFSHDPSRANQHKADVKPLTDLNRPPPESLRIAQDGNSVQLPLGSSAAQMSVMSLLNDELPSHECAPQPAASVVLDEDYDAED